MPQGDTNAITRRKAISGVTASAVVALPTASLPEENPDAELIKIADQLRALDIVIAEAKAVDAILYEQCCNR